MKLHWHIVINECLIIKIELNDFVMILATIATLYKYMYIIHFVSRYFIIRGYYMYTLHEHSIRLEKLRTRTI